VLECLITVRRVLFTGGIITERISADGRVLFTSGIAKEGECSIGCVLAASTVI
jgi:hypothetical protein